MPTCLANDLTGAELRRQSSDLPGRGNQSRTKQPLKQTSHFTFLK